MKKKDKSLYEKLDHVLNLIHDNQLLNMKNVPKTFLLTKKQNEINIGQADHETEFALRILIEEKYVREVTHNVDATVYSLTTSGILVHESGGFVKKAKTERRKQWLIDWSFIAVIVAGLYYLIEIAKTIIKVCL